MFRVQIHISLLGCLFLMGFFEKAYTQQAPLRLWYDEPAKSWEACVPLGNGRLGAMPDGGVLNENMVINDITLWSGSRQDADKTDAYKYLSRIQQLLFEDKNNEAESLMGRYFVCEGKGSGHGNGANVPYGSYQMLANLNIKYDYGMDSTAVYTKNYSRELSLDNAVATTKFNIGSTSYTREYFTSFDDDVIAIKLSASQLRKVNFIVTINRPEHFNTKTTGNELQMSGQLNNGTDGKGMRYLLKIAIKHEGGKMITGENSLQLKNANSAVIYISAATDFKNVDFMPATEKILKNAFQKSYSSQKADHIRKFQLLFKRASFYLGNNSKESLPTDKRLENFAIENDNGLPVLYYQYGRYLLICSTRPGLLPPNLQGLWCNTIETPWNGDYHLNINIQMNHWPLEAANLGVLNEPFHNLVMSLVLPGEKTAKTYYNANGWVAHAITNVWGYTSPGEHFSWGSFNTGSAWLCHMLWSHYEFSGDIGYLQKLFPILKGSAEFYLSTLVKEPSHDWLVTAPSNSPENAFILPDGKHAHVCEGPTMDNQIIRWLFSSTIEACNRLKADEELKLKLEKAKSQLPPNQVGKDGRLMEWLKDYKEAEPHHRHVSHLWGLHPGNEISIHTPNLAQAAKQSLESRGDDGTGWSLAWKINFWARLQDGQRAFKLLGQLLRPVKTSQVNMRGGGGSYDNLFCAHPPFQIDGNFGATAGISEMLLQSQNGYIELLPALPNEWKTGSFSGWCVRGNAEVSANWNDHKIKKVIIKANANNAFKIKLPGTNAKMGIIKNRTTIAVQPVDGYISLRLKKGDVAEIYFR